MEPEHLYPSERLNALTDGVIGVALTLLVLQVDLPQAPYATSAALGAALLGVLPRIELWASSFLVIGTLWVIHHGAVGRQRVLDAASFALGLLLLGLFSLLPFSVSVVGDHPGLPLALLWFWGHVLLIGLTMSAQLIRVRRLPDELRQVGVAGHGAVIRVVAIPAIAAASCAAAWLHPRLSLWGWLVVTLVALPLARPARSTG